ncbi:hypothetical protein Peur_045343 [Populus x canadensis]
MFDFELDVLLCSYARAYIFSMFCNILFTGLSEMFVPLFYVPPMKDFKSIPLCSCGSGVLACLYRHLCQTNLEKAKQVRECLLLL